MSHSQFVFVNNMASVSIEQRLIVLHAVGEFRNRHRLALISLACALTTLKTEALVVADGDLACGEMLGEACTIGI